MVLQQHPSSAGAPAGTPNASAEPAHTTEPPRLELRRLDWDTAFFGALMGTIALTASAAPPRGAPEARAAAIAGELQTVLAGAGRAGYAHLIFRAPAEDAALAWAAESAGLRLVDVGIDSSRRLDDYSTPEAPSTSSTIRAFRPEDVPALRELAGGAFVLSRFSADPFFSPQQVIAFHREWMKNLCGGLADAIFVSEVDGRLAGFVSCSASHGEGRIPLIATDPAFRRQGVGRGLIAAALRWFAEAGAEVAHVKTQAHNYAALALYHRAGFTVSKAELTFSTAAGAALRPARAARPL